MRFKHTNRIFFTFIALSCWVVPACAAPRRGAIVVDVTAAAPGFAAEEVERQVTIPLEVLFAGIPRLDHIRSQSLPGLACVRLEFRPGTDLDRARQEVINRLALAPPLPAGVTPQLTTATLVGQLVRYVLRGPKDAGGKDIYTVDDLRSLQNWVLEREFRRVPRVIDLWTAGGAVKRYEIHPDPDRLKRYGITLAKLQDAILKANANTAPGGDYVRQARGVGLFGGGEDPVQKVLTLKDPQEAAAKLRAAEQRRLREIRSLVIASIKDVSVRVGNVVEGGPLAAGDVEGGRGVVLGHEPRPSRVGCSRRGKQDEDDLVQGTVILRPGEDAQSALRDVRARIKELNETPGRLLPGVKIEPYYERPAPSEAGGDVLWVRGVFPVNVALEAVREKMRTVRDLLVGHPDVREVVSQIGGGDDGMNPAEHYRVLVFVRLKPVAPGKERRSLQELADQLVAQLNEKLAGVDWDAAAEVRDELQEVFTAAPGRGLLKVHGRDLETLERLAEKASRELNRMENISRVQITHTLGRSSLEFRMDRDKCKRWGVTVADLNAVLQAATGGIVVTSMVEGEKTFDVTLRWPPWRRANATAILDLPVDVSAEPGPDAKALQPRMRLRELVSPLGDDGEPDPKGSFLRRGAAVIYREEGRRLITVRFRLGGKDMVETLDKARRKLTPLFEAPYGAEWQGGF
jgi:Cu/Ag efflux pump CusA